MATETSRTGLVICYPLRGYGDRGTIHRDGCSTLHNRYGTNPVTGDRYRGYHLYEFTPFTSGDLIRRGENPRVCSRCKPEGTGLPETTLEPVVVSQPRTSTTITVDYVRNVRYGERKRENFQNMVDAHARAIKLARERKRNGDHVNTYITINTSVINTITVEGAR